MLVVSVLADVTRYEPTETGRLRVAMLQGDDEELSLAEQQVQLLTDDHLALADRLQGHYDLIVFPEGALDADPDQDPNVRARLTAIADEHGASLLVNARTPVGNGEDYNSNIMYDPDGTRQGIYSKQHLVPFGEYVPWRDALGFISELRQIPYDFRAGDRTVVFRAGGHRIGSVICFESGFGPLVRDSVRKGAEIVVVSTNNRSYHRSGNSAQHLANSQMRAAETARPVLQASVSGIERGDRSRRERARHDRPVREGDRVDHGADHDRRDALRALRRVGRAALVPRADRRALVVAASSWHTRSYVARSTISLIAAIKPTTTITPRSNGAGIRRPMLRAELRTDDRPDRDERGHVPGHVGGEHEHDRGNAVRDRRQHVLHAVQALEVLGDEDPEEREQDHALRGTEVAAVDTGEEHEHPQHRAAVLHHLRAPRRDHRAQPRLHDHERAGDHDQHRHHVVEHRARQREEEHRTGEPADEASRRRGPSPAAADPGAPGGSRTRR